jgi:hypothetical protein
MAKTKTKDLVSLADELESTMDKIEALKAELQPLEEREEEIRKNIVQELLKNGVDFIRTTSGLSFGMVSGRTTFSIRKFPGMKEKAVKWAQENFPSILTIGSADLSKICKPMLDGELPEFVERKDGEPYLAVRS